MTHHSENVPLILVVDHEEANRGLARMALEEAGLRVVEADSGRAGLQQFEASRPDLVVLNAIMPGLDGFAVCMRIRALPSGAHLPVLMITGADDVDAVRVAYEAGATDFAAKPVDFLLLAQRVLFLLRAKRDYDTLRASDRRRAAAQRLAGLGDFEAEVQSGRFECSEEFRQIAGLPAGEEAVSREAMLQQVLPEDRDAVVRALDEAVRGRRAYGIEYRILRSDGEVRSLREEGGFLESGTRKGVWLTGIVQDVTERRRSERQARRLTFFDGVTGLPNRTLMRRQLAQTLGMARRHNRLLALLVVDLDHFERVNESLGHSGGDDVLRLVGRRLQQCVRQTDSVGLLLDHRQDRGDAVARVAGDEFVIMLTEIDNAEGAALVARRIRDILGAPCLVGGSEITVTASLGISVFPLDSRDGETLLRLAEEAMRKAKRQGRNGYQFASATINARALERVTLESNLRGALEAGQFELHYQPKVRLTDGRAVGVEALVRWRHPELGMVSPEHFIPLAESSGLILPLGEWVLREACSRAREWREAGLPPLAVSVNLSGVQVRRGNLQALVPKVISENGLSPELLELELTERALMDDLDGSMRLTKRLDAMGIRVSVDDFGIGCSAVNYLKRFPVHSLKIDHSLVRDIGAPPGDSAVVSAILALAHSLQLNVVAEGVENEGQLRFLSARNCDAAQGYYFSKPLTAEDFVQWVRRQGGTSY